MNRKFVCAALVTLVAVSVAMSGEYFASITKVDGDNVTFQKMKKGKKGQKGEKDGEPMTLSAKDATIVKGKFDTEAKKLVAGDKIEDGLKGKVFAEITADKGVTAVIITDEGDKKITEIRVLMGKKKKDADK